jgi:hypothetical protein
MSKKMLILVVVAALAAFGLGWAFGQTTGFGLMRWGMGYGLHYGPYPMFANGMPFGSGFSWTSLLFFALMLLMQLALWLAPIALVAVLVAWLLRLRTPQA